MATYYVCDKCGTQTKIFSEINKIEVPVIEPYKTDITELKLDFCRSCMQKLHAFVTAKDDRVAAK